MSRYPILVARYKGSQSLTKVCETCEATGLITVDEINQDDIYSCPAGHDEHTAVMKYVEADRCPNCRRLGFYDPPTSPCCSRVCALQWEYAQSLAASGQEHRSS